MSRPLLGLGLLWLALAGAAPLPLRPPLPDLTGLVPFVAAPLDKPAVPIPAVAVPAPPAELPSPPLLAIAEPVASRPMAPLLPPRAMPCAGAWLRIPTESLECGRSNLAKGDWGEAARHLAQAVRTSGADRELRAEARYWEGEALLRLDRILEADWLFRQVAQDQGRQEFGPWALHASGWTALRAGEHERARQAFEQFLSAAHPAAITVWARHGLGLALYALRRLDEARHWWGDAVRQPALAGLERDLAFWHGEALGQLGQPEAAVEQLAAFVRGGPHPLLTAGQVRLGWWQLGAGRAAEAIGVFKTVLATPALRAGDRDLAEAGLTLALIATGDLDGARQQLARLDAGRSALAVTARLRLAAALFASGQPAAADPVLQELLVANLLPSQRAWVLLVKGEVHHAAGNRDEARTQFELARTVDPTSRLGQQAAVRLAQTRFELREFPQAQTDAAAVTGVAARDLRLPALVIEGEAAYHAGDFATAAEAYRRALQEAAEGPAAPGLRQGLAWTALRSGDRDGARQRFLEFARLYPAQPPAVDALLLASELTLARGDFPAAARLLDQAIAEHPTSPRTEFARLNRAILRLRQGDPEGARRELAGWIGRATFGPFLGRAHGAHGVALLAAGRPAEAAVAFTAGRKEGLGALAALGLGMAALAQGRWEEAARLLPEARDWGPADLAATAEYGLAVAAFHRGSRNEFRPVARARVEAEPRGRHVPVYLYLLAGVAAEQQDWPEALAAARRLVTDFAAHEAADDALERVGAAATQASAWPVVYEAYGLLRARYPNSEFAAGSQLSFAHAALATGQLDVARREYEGVLTRIGDGPEAGATWLQLARAREAAGDRGGAIEAYARAGQQAGQAEWGREARVKHVELLLAERRWAEARTAGQALIRDPDPGLAAEAALMVAAALQGQGDGLAAAEYYLTAAYVAPDTPDGRRGLLGAGQALAALRRNDEAAVLLRKLLAQADVPAELAQAARQTLAGIGR